MKERTHTGFWKLMAWIVGSFITIFFLLPVGAILYFTYPNRVSSNPDRIASKAGIHLPDYTIVERSDNFDRSSSAWSEVAYTLQATEPLSSKFTRRLDRLVEKNSGWFHGRLPGVYQFRSSSSDDDPVVGVSVNTETGEIHVFYTWWDMLF